MGAQGKKRGESGGRTLSRGSPQPSYLYSAHTGRPTWLSLTVSAQETQVWILKALQRPQIEEEEEIPKAGD